MDIQGSQFHLLHGQGDWGRCTDAATGLTLATACDEDSVAGPSAALLDFEYNSALGALRLRHDLPLFRRAGRTTPIDPAARRGAGRGGYGSWGWIGADHARTSRGAG